MSEEIVTMDQLNYFWMPNGAPCFMADRSDICDIVENLGFSIYYLLGNEQKITTSTSTVYKPGTGTGTGSSTVTTQTVTKKPSLFKVVNNFVGRAVAISSDPLPEDFLGIEESCVYNMPLIPYQMVEKLDQFFRLVYAKHGTESIVLLTYDPSKEGPEGWGILVPEQKNTSAHCNYDAESVLALKPENVYVVGSVHSHPDMPAYASGTDHADQADFDGVHITYGWQKSVNGGATQYYVELQLAGHNYKLDPDDVFDGLTFQKDPDPEVVEWSEKVKKAYPPSGGAQTVHSASAQNQQAPQSPRDTQLDTIPGETGSKKQPISYKQNINSLGVESDATVVAEVYPDEIGTSTCPSCAYDLDDSDYYAGYCGVCDIPIAVESSSINSIGRNLNYYRRQRSLPQDAPAYLWGKDASGVEFLIAINLDKALSDTFYDDDDLDYVRLPGQQTLFHDEFDDSGFHPDYLVCCGERAEDYYSHCKCDSPIFYEDYQQFDEDTAKISIYDTSDESAEKSCVKCSNFYTAYCPAYKAFLAEYAEHGNRLESIANIPLIKPCEEFYPYKDKTLHSSDYY